MILSSFSFLVLGEESEAVIEPEIITVNRDKALYKLNVHDTEVFDYAIDLEKEHEVFFEIENNNILTVDYDESKFSVNAKQAGETSITILVKIVDENKSYTKVLNFKVIEQLGTVTFNEENFYLIRGLYFDVDYDLTPDEFDRSRIVWESSNNAVASVAGGRVTGHKVGSTTITATLDGKVSSMTVYVTVPLKKIEFNPTSVSVLIDETLPLPSLIYVPYDTTIHKNPTYTVDDSSILSLENGIIKGLREGQTTITASVRNITTTLHVTVKRKNVISDTHLFILEKQKADDSGLYFEVRDFEKLQRDQFELMLPTEDVLEYMENREETKVFIKLEPQFLSSGLSNMKSFIIEKDILLQLGAQKIEFIFVDETMNPVFNARFNARHKNNFNLNFQLTQIDQNDALMSLVKNTHSHKLVFLDALPLDFEFSIHESYLESQQGQYHYIYAVNNDALSDTGQKVQIEDGMLDLLVEHQTQVISLSSISLSKDMWVVYTLIVMVVGVVAAITGKNLHKLRKKD